MTVQKVSGSLEAGHQGYSVLLHMLFFAVAGLGNLFGRRRSQSRSPPLLGFSIAGIWLWVP